MTPEEQIKNLREQIAYHSDRYYNQDNPEISDYEFDQLMLDAMQAEQESEKTLKLKEAEQLLLGDADVMPLYREDIVVTSDSARVTGWTVSQNGTYWFGGASLV